MRLEDRVGLGQNPVLLEPFGHQVAGQASMLIVDAVTVCKPLIPREHFVYRTMPPQLLPFTPRYKGVLYVQLQEEEDGQIKLLGYHPAVDDDNEGSRESDDGGQEEDDRYLQAPSQLSSGTSTPASSGSELDVPSAVEAECSEANSRPQSGCVVRVLQCGSYEVSTSAVSDNRVFITNPLHHSDNSNTTGTTRRGSSDDAHHSPLAITHPINPWGFSCHTRLLDKMRKSLPSSHGCPFLQLENVVASFARPCILDLKVGSRLHGDNANQKKIASQTQKCESTTSKTLGLRLCGMQVYQVNTGVYKSMDKYHGRKLTDATFRTVLRDFLHNGVRLRRELLAPVLSRLTDLVNCLERLDSFRFYASSLLIMYDGLCEDIENKGCQPSCQQSGQVEQVRRCEKDASDSNVQEHKGSHHSLPKVRVTSELTGEETVSNKSRSNTNLDPQSDECSPSAAANSASPVSQKGSADTLTRSTEMCQASNFGGDNGNVEGEPATVEVRMIDFAHTTHSGFPDDTIQHKGPDHDYISGLRNLITLFSELMSQTA